MKRSERLYALVDHLRARSPRPVYAEPGRSGGYTIGREFSLPLLQFSATEASAINHTHR